MEGSREPLAGGLPSFTALSLSVHLLLFMIFQQKKPGMQNRILLRSSLPGFFIKMSFYIFLYKRNFILRILI